MTATTLLTDPTPVMTESANVLIGKMIMLIIRNNCEVPRDEFIAKWREIGLPDNALPTARTPRDAFRVATPRRDWRNGLALLDYTGRQKLEKDASLHAILVRSQDSQQAVSLDHENRATIYLAGNAITYQPNTPLDDEEVTYIENIEQRYQRALACIDGGQIRDAIGKVLRENDTLPLNRGTLLIPSSRFALADQLLELIDFTQVYTYIQHKVFIFPVFDLPESRAQLHSALNEYIYQGTNQLIAKGAALPPIQPGKRPRKRSQRDSLIAQLDEFNSLIGVYEELFGMELVDTRRLMDNQEKKFYLRLGQ